MRALFVFTWPGARGAGPREGGKRHVHSIQNPAGAGEKAQASQRTEGQAGQRQKGAADRGGAAEKGQDPPEERRLFPGEGHQGRGHAGVRAGQAGAQLWLCRAGKRPEGRYLHSRPGAVRRTARRPGDGEAVRPAQGARLPGGRDPGSGAAPQKLCGHHCAGEGAAVSFAGRMPLCAFAGEKERRGRRIGRRQGSGGAAEPGRGL